MRKVFVSSIAPFYKNFVRASLEKFSVPAFNLRILTFDSARALFKAAKKCRTNLFIIELAQSEMNYTKQSPKYFSKNILKAAEAEDYKEQIFLQADHFRPNANLEKLIKKSIKAGFYNIDIDCSSLSLSENIKETNYYIEFIKKCQPKGLEINIGGELGDIGSSNTRAEELEEFLQKVKGINKVAVQTGTVHGKGGAIDWQLVQNLSQIAKKYGLAGIVQHGASTLSEADLRRLPQCGVREVHLATKIMQTILEHPSFPYKISKQEIGAFKDKINKIPQAVKNKIMEAVEEKFLYFFNCLKS
ncbi:hypothetical protein COT20_02240 [bacterium (Candidatus Gribaldobacteria) CG08_land_8_20_14_0_20_39_15]|uniref:Aldolase n=1 Tax=bacterium (Candidatus Gribaldobacteria) CG08_land_8_20_14_0_20_39_15 TaxID=2014273 RepID=A0A2M6XU51_9BACT|nr:MAG: hypothetical protein COT20_02240 [bacterium (Candidatus Gribaldobacteria) CG08_land_8_20_14_0_20_39_15]